MGLASVGPVKAHGPRYGNSRPAVLLSTSTLSRVFMNYEMYIACMIQAISFLNESMVLNLYQKFRIFFRRKVKMVDDG